MISFCCLLPPAYCLLPTAYCRPPTADCLLPTAYCRLPYFMTPANTNTSIACQLMHTSLLAYDP